MARFAVGALLVLHFLASIATAQDAMSGIPSFSTQEATRYESLNIANGNVMVEIPVRHKSGKISIRARLDWKLPCRAECFFELGSFWMDPYRCAVWCIRCLCTIFRHALTTRALQRTT